MSAMLYTDAKQEEPIITGTLLGVAEKNPGFIGGFAYRLKSEESLERKITADARDLYSGDPQKAANRIKDANRYTLLYTDDKVGEGARQVLADLQRRGFKASKVKNWFDTEGPMGYRGVNVQMQTPGGHPWELQFHTPTSFEAKSGEGHRLYEEWRTSKDRKRKKALALASEHFYRTTVHATEEIGLSKKHSNPEADAETARIKEHRDQYLGKRHKFAPAKWTHPNGHPRCRRCLQEQPIGGVCTPPTDLANHFDPNQPRDPHTGQWAVDPANIVNRFKEATAGEHAAGRDWYPAAHRTAVGLSKKYGVSVQEAAGLLATYSPQTPWGRNQVEAAETLRYGHGIGGPKAAVWFSHNDPSVEDRVGVMATGVTRKLADAVLTGEDFDEATAGRNKNGSFKPKALKIRNFYHLIAAGAQADPAHPNVVIDRHAMSVALGHRLTDEEYEKLNPGGSYAKYAPYIGAYKQAADELTRMEGRTVTPEEVQATTWLVQQRSNAALDTRVGKTRKALGKKDWDEWTQYAANYLGEMGTGATVGYSEL